MGNSSRSLARRALTLLVTATLSASLWVVAAPAAPAQVLLAGQAPGPDARKKARAVKIVVLSSRADLVSGGDALVRVVLRSGRYNRVRKVTVNGRTVTGSFALRADGQYTGLVTGLARGKNTIRVRLRNGAGAQLTVTNRPSSGPLFSGAAGPAVALQRGCPGSELHTGAPLRVLLRACGDRSRADPGHDRRAARQRPLLPALRPGEPAAAGPGGDHHDRPTAGRSRSSCGSRPGSSTGPSTRSPCCSTPAGRGRFAAPQDAWNRKLFLVGGPNCGVSYQEGSAPGVLYGKVLGRGFATRLARAGGHRQQLQPGDPGGVGRDDQGARHRDATATVRYSMSIGGSGASLVQQWIANAYPGLYDGLIVEASFPDAWTELINTNDCISVLDYWNDPTRWAPGVTWGPAEQSAVADGDAPSSCVAFQAVVPGPVHARGRDRPGPARPGLRRADPSRRGAGHDLGLQRRAARAQARRRPGARWRRRCVGASPTGHSTRWASSSVSRPSWRARSPPAQFIDINAKVGGRDIDYRPVPQRTVADAAALTSGRTARAT